MTNEGPETTRDVAARMTSAAEDFLAALAVEQRQRACYPFESDGERRHWYNAPTLQTGLTVASMRPEQQRLAHRLAATGLSEGGYVTAAMIMGYENVLDASEGWHLPEGPFTTYPGVPDHDRGRDPLMFFVSIFGQPGAPAWGWRMGGHHLSLNYTVVDDDLVAPMPMFFGANPAQSPMLGPPIIRLLGSEEDLGRELMAALGDDQRDQAIISEVPPFDVLQGSRPYVEDGALVDVRLIWGYQVDESVHTANEQFMRDYMAQLGWNEAHAEKVRYTTKPKGLAAADMPRRARAALDALLDQYLSRMPSGIQEGERAKLRRDVRDGLHFAWAGDPSARHCYYRIHGEETLIEYSNVQRDANHAHSLWRDPRNDFGADILRRHYRHDHAE